MDRVITSYNYLEYIIMWDLTGKKVKGLYLGVEVLGIVENTFVNYGTAVTHHVVLNDDYVSVSGGVERPKGDVVFIDSQDITEIM